ncbi:hypothetical protein J6590_053459 [Homalodisca vitripennis]|nr:hypothetical protein J6590_053459 [Homalodisca vitripennis]
MRRIFCLLHVDISEERACDSEVGCESDAEDCIPGVKVMNTPSTRSSNVSLSPKNCDEVKGLLSFGLDTMMTAVPSSSGLRFVRKRGQINHKISDESDSSGPGDETDDDPSYSPNLPIILPVTHLNYRSALVNGLIGSFSSRLRKEFSPGRGWGRKRNSTKGRATVKNAVGTQMLTHDHGEKASRYFPVTDVAGLQCAAAFGIPARCFTFVLPPSFPSGYLRR